MTLTLPNLFIFLFFDELGDDGAWVAVVDAWEESMLAFSSGLEVA